MLRKLLFTILLLLVHTVILAVTNTYVGGNGDWNTATNWSTGLVPSASDDVVIPSGITVNISANSFAKNISLSGTLTINDGVQLSVYNNFTVNSGGSFKMPGGSGLSILVVYGNYVNSGSTDFWKSTVVIAGDLLSSATSDLQKQGNVVVGGNIIGDFDLTGGTGTGQIYAVNPNATVTITPTSIDNNVAPGTQVVNTTETQALVDLVNLVIYGGSCPFSITNPTNVAACSGQNKTFSVVASGSAYSYAYQWQVNDGSGWVNLADGGPYSTVTTSTLSITGATTSLNNYQYRVKITSNACTKNSNYATLSVSGSTPSTPGIISGLTTQCATNTNNEIYSVAAVPSATKYNWLFPSGWTITSGLNTNVVTVQTSGASAGNITVTAENGCGVSSARSLAITIASTAVPATPVLSASTGITCAAFVANWSAAANATSYILDVSIDNGNGSNSFDNKRLTAYTNLNIGNVTSYNVILLNPSTIYYYRITAVNSCKTTPSTIQTITTASSALGAAPTIIGSATVCASASGIGYSIPAVSNATNYFWTVPSGWIITSGQGTISVTVTSGISGGNVSVSAGNDCVTSVTSSKAVTVNSTPSPPTIGAITQPDCVVPTGSVVLSGLPTSGSWSLNQNGIQIYSTTGGSGSYQVSGLTSVSSPYTFTVSNVNCTSVASASVVIASATNTWTTSWSNGTPTGDQALVFSGTYPPVPDPAVDIVGCSCTISNGANVTIKSGRTLTITNGVTVVGGGSLIFEDTASLVQINNAINTGNIVYKRTTPSLIETDYTYWSSPVTPQTLNISPDYSFGTFYSYDFSADNWAVASLSDIMIAGNGYIIRGQKPNNTAYTITGTFIGVPNNGNQSVNVGAARGTSILLGNPYPSALDADAFLAANAGVLEGTLYFWTHNTAIQLATNIALEDRGSGVYAYTSDDYASYNGVGGTETAAAPGANTNIPSGKIAAGQGFFGTIKASVGTTNIVYTNSMRLGPGPGFAILDNSQFFKTRKPKETIEKHRVWLNLTNTEGAFKQTLLGYVTGATNDNETRFDGESYDGNEFVDFYSVNKDQNLVIQGRALPFDENDEVPLGYRTAIEGTFSINIEQVDGLLANQDVFIEDKLTDAVFDLKSGNYTFNTAVGTFNDRFVLRYKNSAINKTLGIDNVETTINKVLVSNINKQIKINSFSETIGSVTVYDVLGKLIYQKNKVDTNELLIANLGSSHQTLVVKTELQNGTTVTDKIIF